MSRRYIFLDLNQSELATLQHFMNRMAVKGNFRARLRGSAILMSNQKKTIKEIARSLGKTETSVYNWLKRYREKGIEGIAPFKPQTKLTDEQVKELLSASHYSSLTTNRKEYHNRWSFRRMSKWIEEKWNIKISYERIRQIIYKKMRE
jgi:transposase